MTIGAIRDLMGDYEPALAAYERARAGLETLRDADYYTLLNEIGITYMNLGRYEDALAVHLKSLEGREQIGDKYYIGISHSNIGETYFALGQYDRAIGHYMQCLRLCGFAGDMRAVAVALGELATAWMAAGNPRRGLEYAQRELKTTQDVGASHLESIALRHVAQAHALLGNVAESIRGNERAFALARAAGARSDEAGTLTALAGLYLQQGDAKRAAPLAESALKLAQATRSPDLEVEARVSLARVARAANDPATALVHLEKSVAIIDSVRGLVRTDSGKIGYLDIRQNAYHDLAATLSSLGRNAEALEVAEAARGRAFSDLLAAQSLDLKPEEATSLRGIRAVEAKLRAQQPDPSEEGPEEPQLAMTRAATESALGGQLRAMRAEQPELASLIAAEPLTVREITATASRLGATLVEYLVTERQLLIWVVKPSGEITSASVDVSRETLRSTVRLLRDKMNSATKQDLDSADKSRPTLAKLYAWTLEPIAAQLPQDPGALVAIVPHDALHLVPFAALVDRRGEYVVRQHTLMYAPAAAVLRYTAKKKQQVVSAGEPHLLAMGDPVAPKNVAESALPGARVEVREIGKRFAADRSLVLVGEQATEANAKRLSPGQTVLHFAVHGLVRDDRPWDSALIFGAGEGEDGWLKVTEIFGLDLHADLITLSGCSTGLGRISGDGIVGLARALIYAGTPSIIVSQWDVSDLGTSYLMDRFYARLMAGEDKAHALRDAQLETLKAHPHPLLWAPFSLVGEPK
jgi:CHAT domain-containing protein